MQEHVSVEQILIRKKEFFDQINDLYLFMLRIIMIRIVANLTFLNLMIYSYSVIRIKCRNVLHFGRFSFKYLAS